VTDPTIVRALCKLSDMTAWRGVPLTAVPEGRKAERHPGRRGGKGEGGGGGSEATMTTCIEMQTATWLESGCAVKACIEGSTRRMAAQSRYAHGLC